ncbi:uncharacterized protein AB675_3435 [Cyphellophora attinorum]|uniref:Uncharacterized protein n=1 Tax=Cyphellophora attinorum TaxID=1664694 RepID=A0A0N0NLW2_9EURO|nr:uncharacterized protein AB675_3435 [Phialophora attinorum]KPI39761.1 hypothetical protein AB675_3435 [Phialophora attinorum]
MHSLILSTAIAALSTRALAGIIETRADPSVLQFVDGDWEDKNQGDVYPIKWSKGNGQDVAVSIKGEGGYSEILCETEEAPGELDWTIDIPNCGVEYSIWLKQENCEELESPKFKVLCPAPVAPVPGNWSGHPEKPSITVVWQDEECSCQKTKVTVPPTPSKTIWYDAELSCSVTATAPPEETSCTESSVPVAPATNTPPAWTAPAPKSPVAPAAATSASWTGAAPTGAKPVAPVATYEGAASKLGGSALALVAVFAAALAL